MRRREFLAAAAGATALAAAAPAVAAADAAPNEEWRNKQPGMRYRRLGRTGFMISGMGIGGDDVAPDNNDYVLYGMDLGVNYFDTAPHYNGGRSEPGYAAIHKARGRQNVFQASKVNVFPNRTRLYQAMFNSLSESEQTQIRSRVAEEIERRGLENPDYLGPYFNGQQGGLRMAMIANALMEKYRDKIDSQKEYKQYIINSVEGSLKTLGTDWLDCVLMRGVETPYEIKNTPEVFEAFEQLKKQGKARFLGFSAHTDPAGVLEAAIETGVYSMCLIAYHFLNDRWVGPVLEKARKADFGVLSMKSARVLQNPVNRRQLQPERVKALNALVPGDMTPHQKGFWWALQNPNLTAVVAGITNMDMAKQDFPLALEKKA
jgi:aryl-alcohol dehydrogenase-like predicted oxidoreductase